MSGFDKVLALFPEKSQLAAKLGESPQSIINWVNRGVPANKVLPIVRAVSGRVTPFEIDPILYPDPNWLPPGVRRPRRKKAS